MSINKVVLYWIIYNVVLLGIASIILIGKEHTQQFPNMTGLDAWAIAASRPAYWIFIILAILASGYTTYYCIKNKVAESGGASIHFVLFGIAALLSLCIFVSPANIKADPIGSGATSEQIEYLKNKGK